MTGQNRRQNRHDLQMWARRFGRRFAALSTSLHPRQRGQHRSKVDVTHPLDRGDHTTRGEEGKP